MAATVNKISSHSTTGIKIGQTSTAKIGLFGATPVVKPANTVSARAALQAIGALPAGGSDNSVGAIVPAAAVPAQLGTESIVRISSILLTHSVKLPAGVVGNITRIFNTSAIAAELLPATGGTINGGAVNVSVTILPSSGVTAFCLAAAPDAWYVLDMPTRSA